MIPTQLSLRSNHYNPIHFKELWAKLYSSSYQKTDFPTKSFVAREEPGFPFHKNSVGLQKSFGQTN